MKKDTLANVLGAIWIATWYLAIWVDEYRWKLFFTGLFSLILGLLIVAEKKESEGK